MQQSIFNKEPESFPDDSSKSLFYKFPDNPCISPEPASSSTTTSTPPFMNSQEINEFDLKKQSSPNKAERRAEHNATERARRIYLNSKFQELAGTLPNLQTYRRPSKGKIVEKALDWIVQSRKREEQYKQEIRQLQNENKRLVSLGVNATETDYPHIDNVMCEVSCFSKEYYHNSQNAVMSYPEAPSCHSKHDALVDSRHSDYSISKSFTSHNDDNHKLAMKAYQEDIQKNPFGFADYNMINSNTNTCSPSIKEQSYSVCSHPSNNSFSLTYYYPPYLS
ncbi:unnamed protein product [Rhizopus stolonifer]